MKVEFTTSPALSEYHSVGVDAMDKDVVDVEEAKGAQMLRDFPKNFKKVHEAPGGNAKKADDAKKDDDAKKEK